MVHLDFPKCKRCRKKVRYVFMNGLCPECTSKKIERVNSQMQLRQGYYFNKWRVGCLRAIRKM